MERDPLYAWAAWGTTAHSGGLALFSTLKRNLHTGLAKVYTRRLGIEASLREHAHHRVTNLTVTSAPSYCKTHDGVKPLAA